MEPDHDRNLLDVFRIIATVQVFLGHMVTHFSAKGSIVNAVYFVRGVPILFLLCGFLAARSLETRSTKKWLWGRITRIFPGFWACIAVNSVLILLVYETKPTILEGIVYAVTQFLGLNFYTGAWLRGYGSGVPNGVLWTIPVQIQFFLLAPIFAKVLKMSGKRKSGILVLGLAVASVLLQKSTQFLPEITGKLIRVTVVPYLYFLVAGMAVWYYRASLIPALQKRKWLLLLSYIIWKLMEDHLGFPHVFDGVLYNTVTTLLLGAVLFAFAFCGSWRMRKDLTFGFYLYHMVFINLALHLGVTTLTPLWKGFLVTGCIVLATLLCAWLSLRYVEIPAAKLLKKKEGRSYG